MATEKASKETRTRTWTIVLYPESAPENWRELLDELHVGWVESPLHEFDVNPTGEVKKAHWHVLLCFGGVKSYEQVLELTRPLNGPIPQRCHDAKAMVRYFAHLDNPEKYQYDPNQIRAHGGVDLAELLAPSASERREIIAEMIRWVKSTHCVEFQDLMDFALEEHYSTWYVVLIESATLVLEKYIRSQRHRGGVQQ